MARNMKRRRNLVILAAAGLGLSVNASAQRSGQSITISHGQVTAVKNVQLSSNAPGGALVGGTLGYAASGGKSSSRKRRNAAIGAVAGAAVSGASQGSLAGREYTVETRNGPVRIISDQTEIVIGDCVVVENAGSNNANIRRASPALCEPESRDVAASPEVQQALMEEAEECVMAKRELAAAQDDAAFDRAIRKVDILCDD
jgi:hypothetical protein